MFRKTRRDHIQKTPTFVHSESIHDIICISLLLLFFFPFLSLSPLSIIYYVDMSIKHIRQICLWTPPSARLPAWTQRRAVTLMGDGSHKGTDSSVPFHCTHSAIHPTIHSVTHVTEILLIIILLLLLANTVNCFFVDEGH